VAITFLLIPFNKNLFYLEILGLYQKRPIFIGLSIHFKLNKKRKVL